MFDSELSVLINNYHNITLILYHNLSHFLEFKNHNTFAEISLAFILVYNILYIYRDAINKTLYLLTITLQSVIMTDHLRY